VVKSFLEFPVRSAPSRSFSQNGSVFHGIATDVQPPTRRSVPLSGAADGAGLRVRETLLAIRCATANEPGAEFVLTLRWVLATVISGMVIGIRSASTSASASVTALVC
jgi:hypothetical protein